MRRVYGLSSTNDQDGIRYVGSTTLPIAQRLGQHLTGARYNNGSQLYSWMREVLSKDGKIIAIDLTDIEDITEAQWVDKLNQQDLFNIQLTGKHGEILRAAWKDSEKRAKMLERDEEFRAAQAKESMKDDLNRERSSRRDRSRNEETRNKIRATLLGRKLGPRSDETKARLAIATKIWHRTKQLGPQSADISWLRLLIDVCQNGELVSPRGQDTLEVQSSLMIVDMTRPVTTISDRKLGYRFMCAEAAWMMSGDDRVETISPYSKAIGKFSDDGVKFFGAYGPKLVNQLQYVADSLNKDKDSRQAVINIWRENPTGSRDIPCHLSCQFMVRNGKLNTFVTMRSSDVWLGICYDIFNFSMWSAYVLLKLDDVSIELGSIYNVAASRHLYCRDISGVEACIDNMVPLFKYKPFNPREFRSGDELINHLWKLAERRSDLDHSWLSELVNIGDR